jgi:hypothetical protein
MRAAFACLALLVGGFIMFATLAYKGDRTITSLPGSVDTFANGTTIDAALLVGSLFGVSVLFLGLGLVALFSGRK